MGNKQEDLKSEELMKYVIHLSYILLQRCAQVDPSHVYSPIP